MTMTRSLFQRTSCPPPDVQSITTVDTVPFSQAESFFIGSDSGSCAAAAVTGAPGQPTKADQTTLVSAPPEADTNPAPEVGDPLLSAEDMIQHVAERREDLVSLLLWLELE